MKTLSLFNVPAPAPAAPVDAEGSDDLDDYDDAARVADPTPPAPHVIVEMASGGYCLARMRDDGTTVARVFYTRAELVELMARCRAALGEPW